MFAVEANSLNTVFGWLLQTKKNPKARKLVENKNNIIQIKSRVVVAIDDTREEDWTGVYVKPKTTEEKKTQRSNKKKLKRRK